MAAISLDSFQNKLSKFGLNIRSHESDLKSYPHVSFSSSPDSFDKITHWCQKNFADDWIWSNPVNTDTFTIYFKKGEHALLCKLTFIDLVP